MFLAPVHAPRAQVTWLNIVVTLGNYLTTSTGSPVCFLLMPWGIMP